MAERLLGIALCAVQRARRMVWTVTRPRTTGARAICLDEQGWIVLVWHSYSVGWFLPGGAPTKGEAMREALARELREEVGMVDVRSLSPLFEVDQRANGKRDRQTVFLASGVRIRPRLSLEIEAIGRFDPDHLPDRLHPSTAYKLARWQHPDRDWSTVAVPDET